MEFLSYARTILAQLDELESLYKQPVSESVSLRVAAPRATYCAVAFADFISQYARSEHIDVHFRETHADQAIKLAQMGQVDFAIVRYQQTAEGYFESLFSEKRLVKRELWSFHMSLMMASDHPLPAWMRCLIICWRIHRVGSWGLSDPAIPFHRFSGKPICPVP